MPRKGPAPRRDLMPDPIYRQLLVTQLVNKVLLAGKRSLAERIVYDALEVVKEKTGGDPIPTLKRAIENVKPALEVKSRRVGGATYQVPVEVNPDRQFALSFRWLVDLADARKGIPMREALAAEILEAYQGQGNAIRKRDEVHKMAQANKAFAHFRW